MPRSPVSYTKDNLRYSTILDIQVSLFQNHLQIASRENKPAFLSRIMQLPRHGNGTIFLK